MRPPDERPPSPAPLPASRSRAPAPPLLSADSRRTCPRCGAAQGTLPYAIPPPLRAAARGHDTRYFWAPCPCEEEQREQQQARQEAMSAARRQAEVGALLAGVGLDQVAGMTLATFDPHRLAGDAATHPYHVASSWLAQITDLPRANYHDRDGPPAALYFYCPGKGRGKTHLAAALAHELRRAHALVTFLHEEAYCSRLWALPFEAREQAIAVPGQQAWLTVLDDLGRMPGGKGVAGVWDGLINRRWLARRWLIVTSNFTLDELAERGTLSDAGYSRLRQMTRDEVVYFDGVDQRLAALDD